MKVNILGTEYTITILDKINKYMKDNPDVSGYMDPSSKKIVVYVKDIEVDDEEQYKKRTLRHEITHAFFYESGLDCNANNITEWARNEEMIDWFAIQSPKIFKVFNELNIL